MGWRGLPYPPSAMVSMRMAHALAVCQHCSKRNGPIRYRGSNVGSLVAGTENPLPVRQHGCCANIWEALTQGPPASPPAPVPIFFSRHISASRTKQHMSLGWRIQGRTRFLVTGLTFSSLCTHRQPPSTPPTPLTHLLFNTGLSWTSTSWRTAFRATLSEVSHQHPPVHMPVPRGGSLGSVVRYRGPIATHGCSIHYSLGTFRAPRLVGQNIPDSHPPPAHRGRAGPTVDGSVAPAELCVARNQARPEHYPKEDQTPNHFGDYGIPPGGASCLPN